MSEETKKKPELPTSGLATAGLVCGISALVFVMVPGLHFILGTIAIVFGAITLKKKRFAMASLVLGIISFAISLTYILFIVSVAATSATATL